MTFSRVAILGSLLWMAAITLLHLYVNVGWFKAHSTRETFKVGFLPVT